MEITRESRVYGHKNISSRLQNCCLKADIDTVGQLVDTPDSKLLRLRNFGRTLYDEVRMLRMKVGCKMPEEGEDMWSSLSNVELKNIIERATLELVSRISNK